MAGKESEEMPRNEEGAFATDGAAKAPTPLSLGDVFASAGKVVGARFKMLQLEQATFLLAPRMWRAVPFPRRRSLCMGFCTVARASLKTRCVLRMMRQ